MAKVTRSDFEEICHRLCDVIDMLPKRIESGLTDRMEWAVEDKISDSQDDIKELQREIKSLKKIVENLESERATRELNAITNPRHE